MGNHPMAKKEHVSETPATQLLKARQVAYTEHPYEYVVRCAVRAVPQRDDTSVDTTTRFLPACLA